MRLFVTGKVQGGHRRRLFSGAARVAAPGAVTAMILLMASCSADSNESAPLSDVGAVAPAAPTQVDFEIAIFRAAPRGLYGSRYDIVLRRGRGNIRILIGESLRRGVQPRLFERAAWSPDGTTIAFTVDHTKSGGRVSAPVDIYVIKRDGSGLRRVTRSGRVSDPLWSRDGTTIVFTKRESDQDWWTAGLWAIGVDGTRERRITQPSEGERDTPGAFSPDGRQLAFTRSSLEEPAERRSTNHIYVTDLDGSNVERAIEHAGHPSWSPDGRWIAFVSDRDKNGELAYGDTVFYAQELYVADADGNHARRLTRTKDLNEQSPSWSPDGRLIAYERGRRIDNAEGRIVMTVKPDGRCARALMADASLRTWYARPTWRPGSRVRSPCPAKSRRASR